MKRNAVLAIAECEMPEAPVAPHSESGDRKSEVTCHVLEPLQSPLDLSSEGAGEGGSQGIWQEGYQKGLEDGLRQAEQGKTFQAANALARAVEQLQAEFSPAAEQTRRAEILELSLAIARRVVMVEMKTNPGAVGEIVSALLAESEGRKVFAVRLHPDDLERLKQSPAAVERLEKAKIALQSSPEIKPGKMGPCFEMRIYTLAGGAEVPKLVKLWERGIPERTKISPLCAAWISELGALNQFVHIWPYKSVDERNEVRKKAQATGMWPPSVLAKKEGLPPYEIIKQENKIVVPSAFSPLQ